LIRKFGIVDAPIPVIRDIFADLEAWPQWMPTVRAVRVLERSQERALAEVDRIHRRRVQTTTFEYRFGPDGQTERQVAGIAKKWESAWRYETGPHGQGTLVSCRLDLDMGFVGWFAPAKMIQDWIDRTFDKTLRALGEQAQLIEPRARPDEPTRTEIHPSTIQVFATPGELEVWVDGRKYVARAAE